MFLTLLNHFLGLSDVADHVFDLVSLSRLKLGQFVQEVAHLPLHVGHGLHDRVEFAWAKMS